MIGPRGTNRLPIIYIVGAAVGGVGERISRNRAPYKVGPGSIVINGVK